eukprot:12007601-Heterocapsa_arctica.AAC.1
MMFIGIQKNYSFMKDKIQNMIITIKINEEKFVDYSPEWTTSRWTWRQQVSRSAPELVRSSADLLAERRRLLR